MNAVSADSGGVICAFELGAAGCSVLHWSCDAGPAGCLPAHAGRPLWLHLNLVDSRVQSWIAACDRLDEGARQVLLDKDPHLGLELRADAWVGTLADVFHDYDEDPDGFAELKLYLSRELIITGRRHPLRSVDQLRHEMAAGAPIDSSLQWLAQLVHQLAASFGGVVNGLGETVDEMEDRILAGRIGGEASELGRLRRLLARLRRKLGGDRQVLNQASVRLPGWGRDADAVELRQAIGRLDAVAQDIELVQERCRLLQEEVAGRLGEATNRNLYLLSIVTTVMLPVTLVTGIFGMNVGGLPWLQSADGFWSVMTLMGLIAIATLALLRWRRLY